MTTTDPSTALARRSAPATAVELRTKMDYARALASSGMLPAQYRGKPDNLLWAVEYGQTLGISPIAAVTGVHVIDGKPTASAGLIGALVRAAGHKLRVKGDDSSATAQIIRADDPTFVFEATWTIARARQAGLAGKGTWSKYPAAMLKARAITEVARDACEDVLFGLHYTPEELGAQVDEEGNPIAWPVADQQPGATAQDDVVDAQIEDEPTPAPAATTRPAARQTTTPAPADRTPAGDRDWMADISACTSLDALTALGQEARAAGLADQTIIATYQRRFVQLADDQAPPADDGPPPDDDVADATVEPDQDATAAWQALVAAAGAAGLDQLDDVDNLLRDLYPDVAAGQHTAEQLRDAIASLPTAARAGAA